MQQMAHVPAVLVYPSGNPSILSRSRAEKYPFSYLLFVDGLYLTMRSSLMRPLDAKKVFTFAHSISSSVGNAQPSSKQVLGLIAAASL